MHNGPPPTSPCPDAPPPPPPRKLPLMNTAAVTQKDKPPKLKPPTEMLLWSAAAGWVIAWVIIVWLIMSNVSDGARRSGGVPRCNNLFCPMCASNWPDRRAELEARGYTLIQDGSRWGRIVPRAQLSGANYSTNYSAPQNTAKIAAFQPTPTAAVTVAMQLAALEPGEVLYDLGCGDGRIVEAAASLEGVGAVGVEIDAAVAAVARKRVAHLERARIVQKDATKIMLDGADVVYLYIDLEEEVISKLHPSLAEARLVISYMHDIPQLETRRVQFTDADGIVHVFYVWSQAMGRRQKLGLDL